MNESVNQLGGNVYVMCKEHKRDNIFWKNLEGDEESNILKNYGKIVEIFVILGTCLQA